MATTSLCPFCQHRFSIEGNRSSQRQGDAIESGWGIDHELLKAQKVCCPSCKCEFVDNEIKFFGFLSRKTLLNLLMTFSFLYLVAIFLT